MSCFAFRGEKVGTGSGLLVVYVCGALSMREKPDHCELITSYTFQLTRLN